MVFSTIKTLYQKRTPLAVLRGLLARARGEVFLIPFLIFGVLSLLYASLLPFDYTSANSGADGGDLLTAILTGGIPHPTGYPTYLLLGRLFQQLPFGTPYWKGALLSCLFSALAAGLAAFTAGLAARAEKPASRFLGTAAVGLALGLAPLFWSQAVIVEVYALQAFFAVCFLLTLVLLLDRPASPRLDAALSILSVLIGLGLGNHLTLFLFFPALALLFRRPFPTRRLFKYAALIAASALLVYAILPLRARAYPPVNWGNSQTLTGFAWLVSGRLYSGLAFSLPWSDVFPRIAYWASELLRQFGPLGLFLGLLGAVRSFSSPSRISWAYLWVFAVSSIFSIGYRTNDSTVYLLPALIIFALWIGAAVAWLWDRSSTQVNFGRLWVGLFFVSLLVGLPAAYRRVDPRSDTRARLFAQSCLVALPHSALLVTRSDEDTFPIWYYHLGLGQRPDVGVVVRGLAGFDWYRQNLQHSAPGLLLPGEETQNWEAALAGLNPGRAVCQCDPAISPPGASPVTCIF